MVIAIIQSLVAGTAALPLLAVVIVDVAIQRRRSGNTKMAAPSSFLVFLVGTNVVVVDVSYYDLRGTRRY